MRLSFVKHKRARIAIAAAILALTLGATIAVRWLALQSDVTEQYVVYSSYLRQLPLEIPGELDPVLLEQVQIVVQDITYAFGPRGFFLKRKPGIGAGTFYDFLLKSIVATRLKPRFELPQERIRVSIDLATRSQTALFPVDFDKIFPYSLGYFIFSPVGFNSVKDEAYFYVEHICGLCGGGRYVLMRKTVTGWKVINEDWTWVS